MKTKRYLGDGVYVENDGFGLILTAENGISATDTIYLEPFVYQKLVNYMNECVADTMDIKTRNEDFEQRQP